MSHIHIFTRKRSWLAIACASALLSACGGGGGGPSAFSGASGKSLSGIAVDGYLQGASVFLDVNQNGAQDAGEPSSSTDLNGRFVLDYSALTVPVSGLSVVVNGGVDSDTGFAFEGNLTASVESASQAQVVTPLTTLVDAMVANNLANDVPSAKQQVARALGLTVAQLSIDPVAAIANQPGIYTTAVALQRAIQLMASANASVGETSHRSQERVVRALALAISSQTSHVDLKQFIASVPLSNATAAQALATAVTQSVNVGLDASGHDGAKAALRALDEVRNRMEDDHDYNLDSAAKKLDDENGDSATRPYQELTQNSDSPKAVATIQQKNGVAGTTIKPPTNTAGRLLASNCFQCHGTGGVGGFEKIRGGEAAEVREYLTRSASSSIMAAHAQGYTSAQLQAIISYLQQ